MHLCYDLHNIVKRSRISSKMFATVNLNSTDDDRVVFSQNISRLKNIVFFCYFNLQLNFLLKLLAYNTVNLNAYNFLQALLSRK